MAISRDEVLHVARLARLALSDEEVERLGAQLNAILEAVGKVTELDLDGRRADRAPARPRQRLGRGRAAAVAAGRGGAGERARPRGRLLPGAACMSARAQRHTLGPVPSPTRAPFLVRLVVGRRSGVPDLEAVPQMIDTLRLTAEAGQRPARDGRGVVGRDLRRVPRRDRRARRRAELLPPRQRRRARRGHPDRAQGRRQHEGHPDDGRLEDPRGLRPGLRRDRGRALPGARAARDRQDEHGRVRDGLVDGELRLRARRGTRGIRSACPAARRAARQPRSPQASHRGRSAPTPAARSSSRLRSAASSGCGRPTAPSPAPASSPSRPASTRSARSRRPSRDCAFLYSVIAGRDPYDSTTVELPEPVEIPEAEDLKGLRDRRPEGAERGRGHRAGRERGGQRRDRALPRARRRGGGDDAAALGRVRPALLLPDRPLRGLVEPRPLRRRPLRAPRRPTATSARCTCGRATQGFGDEPKRRIMLGTYALSAGYYDAYYGQAQKVRTIIRDEFRAALEQFDLLVSPTSPTVAFPLGAKSRQPARDVPDRRARDPAEHGRACPASRSRAGSPRASRSGCS